MTEYREFLDPADRPRVEDTLAGPWIEVWPRVQEAWKRSDAVYIGIVGPASSARVRLEYALALELPTRFHN